MSPSKKILLIVFSMALAGSHALWAWEEAGQEAPIVVSAFDTTSFSLPADIKISPNQMTQLVATLRKRGILRLSLAGHSEVDDDMVQVLNGHPGLRELDLRETGIHDAGVASLRKLVALRTLDLGKTLVGNEGLEGLKHLPYLKKLSLRETAIDDDGLAAFKELQSLRELDLNATALKGKGLVHLKGLKLRALDLGSTQLTADSLGPLRAMMTLQALQINNTHMTNEGLSPLRWLPRLRQLNVSCTNVTDAGLRSFRSRPGLELMNVCADR